MRSPHPPRRALARRAPACATAQPRPTPAERPPPRTARRAPARRQSRALVHRGQQQPAPAARPGLVAWASRPPASTMCASSSRTCRKPATVVAATASLESVPPSGGGRGGRRLAGAARTFGLLRLRQCLGRARMGGLRGAGRRFRPHRSVAGRARAVERAGLSRHCDLAPGPRAAACHLAPRRAPPPPDVGRPGVGQLPLPRRDPAARPTRTRSPRCTTTRAATPVDVEWRFKQVAEWRERHRQTVLVAELGGAVSPAPTTAQAWAADLRQSLPVLRRLRLPANLWAYTHGGHWRLQPGEDPALFPEIRAAIA